MCGLCGILAFDDRFVVDQTTVARMRDTLAHRGPDDADAIVRPGERVALGHRRLAIVDLSPAGRQPMPNEDGTVWITYNGEVYNHDALRAELESKGHKFRSRTDTEAIIHLYEEEGPDCVRRLDGMFALAIWDGRRRELLLARDRIGVKPLYYACRPGGIVFGSEVKALLEHPAIARDLDETAFYDYLTFAFTPPPATMYRGISKLAPAERLIVRSDGSTERSCYWTPFSGEVGAEIGAMSESEMVARLRALLRESIHKRMMSDVPFGVFLSGGVDSSANVALMAEFISEPVRTFATAPRGHSRYDERSYAQLIAERFGTEHHEVLIDSGDMLEFLPRMVHHQDEPTADPTSIPQHFVAQLARDNGTIVVQCGEGSDELFHGYKGYADHRRYVVPFQRLPQPLRRGLGTVAARATRRLGRGIRHGEALYDAGRSSLPYWGGALCFRGEVKDTILRRNGAGSRSTGAEPYAIVQRHWHDADRLSGGADLFQKMTYLELKQRLPELLLMRLDKITMASSVEAREPFLDHKLVEFALALPPAMKYRDGVGKLVLKQAMTGILPQEVLSRPKQGFGTPMEEWLRGDFGVRAREAIRRSSLAERGLLDYERIDELFAAHRAGRGDWHKHLWSLYSISAWHDRWIAGRSMA
jgi:asparagine synthase (glutamine-hydrolysing)